MTTGRNFATLKTVLCFHDQPMQSFSR